MSAASRLQAAWLQRGVLAGVLLPISWLYRAAVGARAALYRFGLMRSVRLPVPVVVVGNLVAGGAGKTPTVIALVQLLRSRGFVPGIVSRGYGRESREVALVQSDAMASQVGDEPLLLHRRTRAPMAVGADRVAAGQALLRAHPAVDIVISDDGLQHTRLARDAQVIVIDERGIGNGWLLPAGPLREPAPRSVPARSVVLYNAPRASTAWSGHLAAPRLSTPTLLSDWQSGRAPSESAWADLKRRRVLAAAGVARPQRFFDMLRQAGLHIDELPLPDHHEFAQLPWSANTPDVIVTEKDAVKLQLANLGATRVWVAALDFELPPAFASELMPWLPPHPGT